MLRMIENLELGPVSCRHVVLLAAEEGGSLAQIPAHESARRSGGSLCWLRAIRSNRGHGRHSHIETSSRSWTCKAIVSSGRAGSEMQQDPPQAILNLRDLGQLVLQLDLQNKKKRPPTQRKQHA